jgi:hypothetical protein
MKIALLFTGDLLYRDGIALTFSFDKLQPAINLYNKDLNKQKLCLMLIRNLLTSETKHKNLEEFELGISILIERLDCFSDNNVIFGNIALILKDSLERVSYIPAILQEARFLDSLSSGVTRHYLDLRVCIHILMLMRRMRDLDNQIRGRIKNDLDIKRELREVSAYYTAEFRPRTEDEKKLSTDLLSLFKELL